MKFVLLFIIGFSLSVTRTCSGPAKSEEALFRETLDSIATEKSTFLNTTDSLNNDSFAFNK